MPQPFSKTLKAGAQLFRENDHSRELYLVQAGTVKIYRQIGAREVELALMEKGAVFGEMALIDGKPRSASAKCATDAVVTIIDAQSFESKIRGVPPWYLSIIKIISGKIRKANKHLQIVGSWNRGCAVILSLSHLLKRYGKDDEEGRRLLDLHDTKKHLIQLLGMTHQIIMQQLDYLHVKGFLEIKDDTLVFPDPARFAGYCTFLRLHLRKGFEKMPSLSGDAIELCGVLAEQKKELFMQEVASCEIPAEEIIGHCGTLGLQDKAAAIITELKQGGLITAPKKEGGEAKGAAGPFSCDVTAVHKQILYNNFSSMVPTA
ncbi:MAG: Crp/Fnr family transcriptional regulator [Chitinivibrionales bacterium]|nr:Crp/Fnr family transcriptional regulator [Chitinivibrionales bacterium]